MKITEEQLSLLEAKSLELINSESSKSLWTVSGEGGITTLYATDRAKDRVKISPTEDMQGEPEGINFLTATFEEITSFLNGKGITLDLEPAQ